jgi:hypothetical protein
VGVVRPFLNAWRVLSPDTQEFLTVLLGIVVLLSIASVDKQFVLMRLALAALYSYGLFVMVREELRAARAGQPSPLLVSAKTRPFSFVLRLILLAVAVAWIVWFSVPLGALLAIAVSKLLDAAERRGEKQARNTEP